MELKLKLKLVPKSKPSRPKKILKRDAVGTVLEKDGKYTVLCELKDAEGFENGKAELQITKESYSCLGKTVVWLKQKKGYIKLVRFEDEAKAFDKPDCYIPFRPGYYVIGNIIRDDDKLYFRIKSCHHQSYFENPLLRTYKRKRDDS